MADSQTTVVSKLLVGTSLVLGTVIGGVAMYVSGAIHSTGNVTGSGSLVIEGVTILQSTLNAGNSDIQPSTGTAALTIEDAADGTGTGGIICIDNTSGTQVVCAVSGGLLDCDSFSGMAATCP